MGNNENTQIARKPSFVMALQSTGYQKLINAAITDPSKAGRFIASVASAVSVNPGLQECDPKTVLSAALLGEGLNLTPSPQLGHFYMVPFGDKNNSYGKVAVFILGYKGYIQLAERSGQYADLDVIEIKEGEYLGKDARTGKPLFAFIADDEKRERLPTIGYLAYLEYLNGFTKSLYWSKEKMLKHADRYSKAFNKDAYRLLLEGKIAEKDMWKYSSYWYQDFDGMAKKTMLRQLISKWGIMSIDMEKAYHADEHKIREGGIIDETMPDDMPVALTEAPAEPEQPKEEPKNEPKKPRATKRADKQVSIDEV
jgi:recombination protein RecT